MAEAYVLINCDLGTEDGVIKELKSVSGVSEVKGVFGVYDVIAKVNAPSESDIKKSDCKDPINEQHQIKPYNDGNRRAGRLNVDWVGFEPTTPHLRSAYSTGLNYQPVAIRASKSQYKTSEWGINILRVAENLARVTCRTLVTS